MMNTVHKKTKKVLRYADLGKQYTLLIFPQPKKRAPTALTVECGVCHGHVYFEGKETVFLRPLKPISSSQLGNNTSPFICTLVWSKIFN